MKQFPYIEVSGSHYECGYQYGRAAAAQIALGAKLYLEKFVHDLQLPAEEVRRMAMACARPVEEAWPELIEEVKGVADGSGVDLGDVMVINCRYELSKFPKVQECTTGYAAGSATKTGTAYLFKNWDFSMLQTLERIVILHITQDDGTRIVGITEAGQLIRDGLNSHGVGIVSNNLQSVYDSEAPGVPTCFMRRRILKSKSFEEAGQVIRTFRRAVSCNSLIGCADGRAIDFEVHPKGAFEILPEQDVLTHANHFVVDMSVDAVTDKPKNRDARLRELLMEAHGAIDIAHIKHCLCDHKYLPLAICRHPAKEGSAYVTGTQTVSSTIMDFANGEVWICAGNPCEGIYLKYTV